MTLRRYVFAYDASDPMAVVNRYLANDNTQNLAAFYGSEAELRAVATNPSIDAVRRRQAQYYIDGMAAFRTAARRGAGTDFFSPTRWAVADADALDRDPNNAAVPAQMRSFLASSSPSRAVSTFIHYADTELATAYLRRAQALSPQFISTLATPEAQNNAVRDLWANVAAYFRAMNVRPWGWAKLRGRWETQIGQWYSEMTSCPMIGREINVRSTRQMALPGSFHELLFARRTTPLNMTGYGEQGAAGAWRDEAMRRYNAQYGVGNVPKRLRFGSQQAIERSGAPCAAIGTEVQATACLGPSGDVHPLWLTNAALLGGGVNYPTDPVASGIFDHHDCVARSLVDGTVTGPELVRGPPGFNWVCGASGDPFNMGFSGRWNPYLPPRLWYALLVWPLVEYLSATDPLRLIYEVQLDVSGKNLWTLISCGEDVSTIVTEGVLTGQIASEGLRGGLRRLTEIAGQGAGIVGLINPLGGAVIGALAASLGLVTQLASIDGNTRLDVFGRLEPAMDSLAIVNRSRGTTDDAYRVNEIMPAPLAGVNGVAPPPALATDGTTSPIILAPTQPSTRPPVRSTFLVSGSMLTPTSGTSTTRQIVETGDSTLRIHAMPPYGAVYIDDEDVPAIGAWEDVNAQQDWIVPIRPGPHRIRVAAPVLPDGSPSAPDRFASVVQIPKEPLTIDYATMPTAAQLANPPSQGMSSAAKAGIVVGAGAIVGLAYVFRRELGLSRKKP